MASVLSSVMRRAAVLWVAGLAAMAALFLTGYGFVALLVLALVLYITLGIARDPGRGPQPQIPGHSPEAENFFRGYKRR